MQSHWARTKDMISAGERLIENGQSREDIQRRIQAMQQGWERLRAAHQALGQWLNEAKQAQQYFQDANEAESWIREKMPLVKSDDLGRDEGAAESLLQRHARLEEEIHAYRADIVRLEEMSQQLANSSFHTATTSSQETEEVSVPQIEMLYKYDGNGMSVVKGLLEQSTPEWWRVLKQDGTEGFVPANYCRKVPGESVTVTQTTTTTKAHSDVVDGKRAIVDRQKMISSDYRQLNSLAEVRRRLLSDNIKLMRQCDEFEGWARETEAALADEPSVEHVKAFRKKFDRLEADMKAIGGTQLKHINAMADELIGEGHSQSRQIEARQRKVNALWADLERLRAKRAAKLETTERVADFDSSCEDAREWMQGKFDLLDRNPNDLKSLQNLERDLKPLEDKIHYLEKLAAEVKKKNPEEAAAIEKKIAELRAMHADLLRRAHEKIKIAEQSQGQEMFETALRDVLVWIDRTKKVLAEDVHALDVQQAEELLKKHYELGEQIMDKKYEVDYVHELGRRLLEKNPRLHEVDAQLKHLTGEMNTVKNMYRTRDAQLKEQLDLQLFNREAERIDAATKGHEAFLDYADLGDSVESVENLLKRHRDLEAKLDAQEGRLSAFSKNADDLIKNRHSESAYIDGRRGEVLARRAAVRRMAAERRARLEASLEYQNMKRDAEEMITWIHEKKKLANDDSHRDLTSIANKLLKHEAFEAEVGANSSRVAQINRVGAALINQKHYESANVDRLLKRLNTEWAELRDAVARKGEKLRQASDQKGLNRVLEDAHAKLDELETSLKSDELGSDLRAVKDLIQKHSVLEQEMGLYEKRLADIYNRGRKMAEQGHFDADRINYTVGALLKRFENLEGPSAARRAALEESRKWHQLAFDVDCELQWIAEKKPIACSEDTGRNLTEALNMVKKQEQLEAEVHQHSGNIETTIAQGEALIRGGHNAAAQIKAKCEQSNVNNVLEKLAEAWTQLAHLVKKRRQVVDWGVKEQQYMFDAAEVESWMNEKRAALESDNYGQDEDAAQKLLAKHKALQKDMQTYRQWLDKLSVKCTELVKSHRPNVDRFEVRQKELETEFDRLSRLAEERCRALEDTVHLFEYMRESADLEQWINEQLQTAMSEEYGDDYEHFKELQSRFEEFKQSVKTGSERFVSCEAAANALLRRNPPFGRDILKKQEKLRSVWTLLLDYIESRESKLAAAEELHRFNQDVLEHEEWVADKRANMSRDKGRNMQQAKSLSQKHETLEKEVAGMEPQLQSSSFSWHGSLVMEKAFGVKRYLQKLLAESARLKEAYPGGNAEHIAQQQVELAESWQELLHAIDDRRDELRAARDMHRYGCISWSSIFICAQSFNADVRDLLAWADITIADMQSEMQVNGLQQAEGLQKEHSRLRGEITARAPEFEKVKQSGEAMIQRGHFDSHNIAKKVHQVNTAFDRLRSEWDLRDSYLVQLVQWHALQQEANQILTLIASKRATLRQLAVGGSVADVEGQKKRLDTFAKALSTLDERTKVLDRTANELIANNHMEKNNIELSKKKVHDALSLLHRDVDQRSLVLNDAFMVAAFDRDVADTEAWIDEKLKGVDALLRKQTALERDMSAIHQKLIAHDKDAQNILAKKPPLKHTILDSLKKLEESWKELSQAAELRNENLDKSLVFVLCQYQTYLTSCEVTSKDHSNGFCSSRCKRDFFRYKLHKYIDQVKKAEQWAAQLRNKMTSYQQPKTSAEAEQLIAQHAERRAEIDGRQDELHVLHEEGQRLIAEQPEHKPEASLQRMLEWLQWCDQASMCERWLADKENLLKQGDIGDAPDAVQVGSCTNLSMLIKSHDAFEETVRKQSEKLDNLKADADKLIKSDNEYRGVVEARCEEVLQRHAAMLESSSKRRGLLCDSKKYHEFIRTCGELITWINAKLQLAYDESYLDPTNLRAKLQKHLAFDSELTENEKRLVAVEAQGEQLIKEKHFMSEQVRAQLGELRSGWDELRTKSALKTQRLREAYEAHTLQRKVEDMERWLDRIENELASEDHGRDLVSVEHLMKKLDALDAEIRGRAEAVHDLMQKAREIKTLGSPTSDAILGAAEQVDARFSSLNEPVLIRRENLRDAHALYEWTACAEEELEWLSDRLPLARNQECGDSLHSALSLQKKHMALEKELESRQAGIHEIESKGLAMVRAKHFASPQIEKMIDNLATALLSVKDACSVRRARLQHAVDSHEYYTEAAEAEQWMRDQMLVAVNQETGRDQASAEGYLRRLTVLDKEVAQFKNELERLRARCDSLQDHQDANQIAARQAKLETSYSDLVKECNRRRTQLVDAGRYHRFVRQVDDLSDWLHEKEHVSFDLAIIFPFLGSRTKQGSRGDKLRQP
ncbi:unnamed protein product [Haemonchus placei]|uniref:SH3 domain-containing protein n=1 Tax=Haemonchus placei TaxID=6290 RepID=A0A0N4X4J3_HAEPC|nr:unnamed protein product [Haemonchus placei]